MKIDKILDDYATRRVPEDKRKSLAHLSVILFAAVITIPIFMFAQTIVAGINFKDGAFAVMIGVCLMTVIVSFMAYIGGKTNLSVAMVARITFGRIGGKVISSLVGIVLLMWFGITVDFFGTSLGTILSNNFGIEIPLTLITIISGLLMMSSAIVGFKGLDKVSVLFSPIIIFVFGVMLYKVFHIENATALLFQSGEDSLTISTVISMLVGGYAAGLVLPPDIVRFAKTAKQGVYAYVFAYLIISTAVMIFSMMLLKITGQESFAALISFLNIGVLGIVLLFTATWTTNDNNLYSSALGIAPLFKNIPKWQVATVLGLLGIGFGVSRIFDYFIPILEIIGTVLIPIVGVIIADFFFVNKEKYLKDDVVIKKLNVKAAISFVIAVIVGLLMNGNSEIKGAYTLTTVPAIDSILLSFTLYLVLSKIPFTKKLKND
ncbi:MAG: cytosine permease [Proteobacteria bacterium]|nr:cytosine permease [Pseudomonadota bacterium]